MTRYIVKVESDDGLFVEEVCSFKHLSDAVSAMPEVYRKYKMMAVDCARVYDIENKKNVVVYQQSFLVYRKNDRALIPDSDSR